MEVKGFIAAVLCAAIAACVVGPDYKRPPVALQRAWTADPAAETTNPEAVSARQWWEQFADPTLNQLLVMARANNPTLQSASVHIAQAQAQLREDQTGYYPSVNLTGGPTYEDPYSSLAPQLGGATSLSIAVQGSWQPDFWGAVRRQVQSDRASWLSTIAAYDAAMISLDSNVASTYFSLRTAEARIAVANANLLQQGEDLRITRARFREGEDSELDERQAEVTYQQTAAQIPPLQAAMRQAGYAIATLLGQPPDYYEKNFGDRHDTPRSPDKIPVGVPRDLLRRRPDVVEAELSAASQSARIGQAKASLYPSLTLNGTFGYTSTNAGKGHLDDLFQWSNSSRDIGASLLFPIFDRGHIVNQVRVQDALFEQSLLAYQNQVLQAQQDVENSLINISSDREELKILILARDAARRSALLAEERYKSGEVDFTTVVTANQARLQVEDSLEQARGSLLQAYASAYVALGGGWDGTLAPPVIPDSVAERMKARTDWGHLLAPTNAVSQPAKSSN
jgi:NodT family efflux transporter outer membrane factor (OMF) lipoprotein